MRSAAGRRGGRTAPPAAAAEEPKRPGGSTGREVRAGADGRGVGRGAGFPRHVIVRLLLGHPDVCGMVRGEWADRLASEVLFPEDKAKEELKAWEAQQRGG